ncbi:helix-turn-helix domain-containing protein [Poriferisphaera sp. WC338]|uniref:helix-turn-helix domain-containing protein n=1 Tax=Poriferisphaera sp. WC338 TaxID=3425129 RepID=UPI003D818652
MWQYAAMENRPKYIDVTALASLLGLPREWVSKEAKAGRIPHIQAGRRLLFHPEAVEEALLARTENGSSEVMR